MDQTVPASESGMTALSMEFVSKPREACRLRTAIPVAIESALRQVPGFAGCMLLISDKEPRLVTVITFWGGENRAELSSKGVARIHKIVAPFLDRCLQVRSHDAYSPVKSFASQVTPERSAQIEGLSVCVA
jgi:hypothetical protein